MQATQRLRFILGVWMAAVLVAGVAAVAADDSDDDDETAASTSSTLVATSSSDTASTLPGDTASTDTTAAPGTTAGGGNGGGATTATTAGGGNGGPTARVQPDPGRYQLRVSGSSNFGGQTQPAGPSGTLVVEQLQGTDQRITQPGGGGEFVLVVRWSPQAMDLVTLTVGVGSFAKTFQPAQPVLFAPFPTDVGATWNWTIDSTDGQTHIAQTSRVTRTETLTIAGTGVPTAVIESVLTLSGDIQGTVTMTTWMSDAERLPIRTHSVTDARAGLFAFSSDITSELVSLRPS